MAITVKHSKTSTIPDGSDSDLIRPSDWNADHTLTGLGTMAEQNANNVAITGGSISGVTGVVSSVTGTAPVVSSGGTTPAISMAAASASSNGYLTSTDWSTFNSKGGGDVVGPASSTDNAIARFDSTTGKLIQNSAVTIDDAGNIISPDSIQFSGTVPSTQPIGTLWFDSSTDTLNLQQNAITQQIGEEIYVYGKASNTITGETLLQAIVKTGVVGASGVIQFGVAGAGVTDGSSFIGVATENIATNGFGRVTSFGVVHGINTSGSTYGETWADGDDIWYNPTTGGLTKTKPSAPNIKVQIGTIIHAGSGGSGSFQVLLNIGSSLGGTDDNVQISSPTGGQLLTYSSADSYWKNTSLAAGTGISVGAATNGVITVTNSAPDQTVTISGTSPITTSGTYPNFTVAITQATTSTSGYLSSTDWNTFNNKATYPSQTGNNGKFLKTDGSSPSWASLPTYMPVLTNAGSTTNVSVANGYLPVLNNNGSTTTNVTVS